MTYSRAADISGKNQSTHKSHAGLSSTRYSSGNTPMNVQTTMNAAFHVLTVQTVGTHAAV